MPRDDEEELDFGEEEDEIFSSTASKSRINDLDSVNSSEGRSQKVEAKSRQEDRSVGSRARDDERGRANQGKRIDTRRRSSPILSEPGRAASPVGFLVRPTTASFFQTHVFSAAGHSEKC